MKFWDSSALVGLLIDEPDSARRRGQFEEDPMMAVWWVTAVECESAIQRRVREGAIDGLSAKYARDRLAELSATWREVSPTPALRVLATRLIRTHPLRAADAFQLAAALSLSAAIKRPLEFACQDHRLAEAAEIEGLGVVR